MLKLDFDYFELTWGIKRMRRREWLAGMAAVAVPATGVLAMEDAAAELNATAPPAGPRFKPAISAYSFRRHFGWMRGQQTSPAEPALDMRGFIDYCARHRAAAELTAYFFPEPIPNGLLVDLKRHAFLEGVTICGTAIGNRFDEYEGERLEADITAAEAWIDRTAMLGGSHIRMFAGKAKSLAEAAGFRRSVAATRRCAARAAERGVMIGLENHGGITAETLLRFVDAVDSPWVGINLDTGNFLSEPYKQMEACVERAVHVQWKLELRQDGRNKVPADFDRIAGILRSANYRGFVAVEYEEAGDPFVEVAKTLERLREVLSS